MTRLRLCEAAAGAMPVALAATTTLVPQALAQSPGTPTASPAWSGWSWIVTIIVILGALVTWGILLRKQARRFRQTYLVEISNRGNVQSRYVLRAEDQSGALWFTFVLGGLELPGQAVIQPSGATAQRAQVDAPSIPRAPSPQLRTGVDTVKRARSGGMRAGSTVAGILDSLGTLLPRSVGTPLLRAAAQIRRGQGKVRGVERLPGRAAQLKSRVVPGRPSARPQPVPTTRQEPIPPAIASATIKPGWVETPFVEPGETLAIDLLIDPANPYRTQAYPLVVKSRSLEQRESSWVVEESDVKIVEPTFLQRYSPFLVTAIIAAAVLLLALALIGTGF